MHRRIDAFFSCPHHFIWGSCIDNAIGIPLLHKVLCNSSIRTPFLLYNLCYKKSFVLSPCVFLPLVFFPYSPSSAFIQLDLTFLVFSLEQWSKWWMKEENCVLNPLKKEVLGYLERDMLAQRPILCTYFLKIHYIQWSSQWKKIPQFSTLLFLLDYLAKVNFLVWASKIFLACAYFNTAIKKICMEVKQ